MACAIHLRGKAQQRKQGRVHRKKPEALILALIVSFISLLHQIPHISRDGVRSAIPSSFEFSMLSHTFSTNRAVSYPYLTVIHHACAD